MASIIKLLKYLYLFLFLFYVNLANAQIGNSLVLDGCTNYFEVPENDLLDYNQVLSIECWIAPNCDDGNRMILSKQYCQGEYGYYLSVNNGRLFWSYSINSFCTSPNTYQTVDLEILPHQFTHVAVVHNQNEIKLFIDGNEVGSEQVQGDFGPINNSSEPFRIGAYRDINGNINNFYSGLVDEIRVWNVELTETLIQQRKEIPLVGNEPGLILYLNMEDSGQGVSLTLQNHSSLGNSLNAIPTGFTTHSPYITHHLDYAENIIDLGDDIFSCEDFVSISIAPGNYKSVLWNNGYTGNSIIASNSGTYFVTVETELCKFYSDTITLELLNSPFFSNEYSICEGDTIILNNIAYFNEGVYFDTISADVGCDTIYEYSISVIPTNSEYIQIETCPNSTVIYNGEELEPGSITSFVFNNSNNCDSIVTIEILPTLILTEELNLTTCEGQQIEYNGTFLSPNSITAFTFSSAEGCDSIVTVTVEAYPANNNFLGDDLIICDEQYSLFSPDENTLWSDGTIAGSITVDSSGIYHAMFIDSFGCINSDTITLELLNSPFFSNEYSICEGDTIILNNIAYFNEGVYFDTISADVGCDTIYEYSISVIPTNSEYIQIETCPNSTVIYNGEELEPGSITSFVFNNSNNCDSIVTIEILPTLILTEELNLTTCEGQQIEYNGTFLSPNSITAFTFSSAEGCDSIVTVTVEAYPANNNFLGDDLIICDEQYSLFSPDENTLWSDGTISGSITVATSGIYYAIYLDSFGCINSDTINIAFKSNEVPVYVPNVFSPNGDGTNDCLKPFFPTNFEYTQYKFSIFSRWGGHIFETSNINECWDGKLKGKYLNPGVYVWVIERFNAVCNESEFFKGDITLLR